MRLLKVTAVAVPLLVSGVPLSAQVPPTRPDTARAAVQPPAPAAEPKLVFEREVYSYPGAAGRRDPFLPLVGQNDAGPLFQDLQLRMILYSAESPARSVASVMDAAKKLYRVRRGDTVGNATVLDVGPRRVLFSVVDFGIRRQEVLELKPTTREGA